MPSTTATTATAAKSRNEQNEEQNARVAAASGQLDAATREKFEGPRTAVRKLRDRIASSPQPDITITEALDDIGRSLDAAMGVNQPPKEDESEKKSDDK